jgi:hypothetical protein
MQPIGDDDLNDAGKARRPAFRVVEGNQRGNWERLRRRRDNVPIILPEIVVFDKKKWNLECEMVGLTNWQRNRAWQIGCRTEDKEKYRSYMHAINRVFLIWQALGVALEWERRKILAILQEHHPAMARKIMKSLGRKR